MKGALLAVEAVLAPAAWVSEVRRSCVKSVSRVPGSSGEGRSTSVQRANLFIYQGDSMWPKRFCM